MLCPSLCLLLVWLRLPNLQSGTAIHCIVCHVPHTLHLLVSAMLGCTAYFTASLLLAGHLVCLSHVHASELLKDGKGRLGIQYDLSSDLKSGSGASGSSNTM